MDIDDVMNNRDIGSIRNALIAVRNKVLQAPYRKASFTHSDKTATLKIYHPCSFLPPYDSAGRPLQDANYVVFQMEAKLDPYKHGKITYYHEGGKT